MKNNVKWFRKLLILSVLFFVLFNISAAFHAYKFTHFQQTSKIKPKEDSLAFYEKVGILFFGIPNPRPVNFLVPKTEYQTINLQVSDKNIEGWFIPTDSAKGSVILCHGYAGTKGSMLPKAQEYLQLGYNVFAFDFRGCGNSTGNQTTIGFNEADDVKAAFDWVKQNKQGSIFFAGTSMGASAVIKSINDYQLEATGLILECPFESLLQTAKNRFELMKVPSFPASYFLVFWGGVENGFNGFGFRPYKYASSIKIPTLLIYGSADERVKRSEIDKIYNNLNGPKELLILAESGHDNFFVNSFKEWHAQIESFLQKTEQL